MNWLEDAIGNYEEAEKIVTKEITDQVRRLDEIVRASLVDLGCKAFGDMPVIEVVTGRSASGLTAAWHVRNRRDDRNYILHVEFATNGKPVRLEGMSNTGRNGRPRLHDGPLVDTVIRPDSKGEFAVENIHIVLSALYLYYTPNVGDTTAYQVFPQS